MTDRNQSDNSRFFSDNHGWTHEFLDWSCSNRIPIDYYRQVLLDLCIFDGSQLVRLISYSSEILDFTEIELHIKLALLEIEYYLVLVI